MDSGVETGNDSNDSLVAQLDNNMQATPVATFNQLQLSNFHHHSTSASSMFNGSSEKNVQDTMQIIDAAPSEAVSQDKVSEASQTSTSTNTSLISVSTFNSGPFFSLALLPAENKAKINTPNMTLEFRIPPLYSTSDYTLPAPLDFKQPPYKNKIKAKPIALSKSLGSKNSFEACICKGEWLRLKKINNERKMRLAAGTNNIEMMKRLLKEGVSPNNYDEQAHRTPLHLAASRGYTEMVSLLLAHGADPNQRDTIGNTPLHLAAVTGKISVVTLLLMAGTDVLSSDSHGYNPLQLAQTKLKMLQRYRTDDSNGIKDEVQNVIKMLLVYLQKQKDAKEQIEALSSFCSKLSLSNTSDQVQDDVRNLLASIDSLSLSN